MAKFTTIDHDIRMNFEITLNEYAICDSIYCLSRSGWCDASKEYLGEFIGITRRATTEIINKMITKNLIMKNSKNRNELKTTSLWDKAIANSKRQREESSHSENNKEKKVPIQREESSHLDEKKVPLKREESSHNIYNKNINKDIYINIYTSWNEKENLRKHELKTIEKNFKKKHFDFIKEYGEESIIQAINNYSDILKSDEHFFSYSGWTLWDFLIRGAYNFMDVSKPFDSFLKNKEKEFVPLDSDTVSIDEE